MIINRGNLRDLQSGFRASFAAGFAGVAAMWDQIATRVPSTTAEEKYGWLGQVPGMREWIGDRQVRNIVEHGYSIANRPFEATVAVPRTSIEDDQYGVYAPLMEELGRSAAAHPDQLVFEMLTKGFSTPCYDGQNFFDTDHPVIDTTGVEQSVSNMQSGALPPWFLLHTKRAIKPLIFQQRKRPEFVALDSADDEQVFYKNQIVYGVDARHNVGFGFWQMAFGSRATLDEANFDAAYDAMTSLRGDAGRPLGIAPNLLVVGPSNRKRAQEMIKAARKTNGADNTNAGIVDLMVCPWLT